MCKFKVYLKVFSVENSPKNLQYTVGSACLYSAQANDLANPKQNERRNCNYVFHAFSTLHVLPTHTLHLLVTSRMRLVHTHSSKLGDGHFFCMLALFHRTMVCTCAHVCVWVCVQVCVQSMCAYIYCVRVFNMIRKTCYKYYMHLVFTGILFVPPSLWEIKLGWSDSWYYSVCDGGIYKH